MDSRTLEREERPGDGPRQGRGSLGAGEELAVTGEVVDKPWPRVETKGARVAYVHERQLTGQLPRTEPAPQSPGVYLTADVSTGQPILRRHLQVIGADRIPSGEFDDYSMVAGGCYAGARAAGGRLDWSDISARCSQ